MTNTTHDRVLREIARAINLIEKYEEGEDNPGLKQRALETLTALQRDVVKPAIKQLMLPIVCRQKILDELGCKLRWCHGLS